MKKSLIAAKNLSESELRTILLGLRFGGAAPDKAAPVFYTLSFLAKCLRKPMSWVHRTIEQALPPDQRRENLVRD